MASVIVPAHNEASVIQNCLDSIIHQEDVSEIIVACNGCTDNTAELVRKHYPKVICLDIEKPSKTNALNEAERHSTSFPIFYLDADTVIDPKTISNITQQMEQTGLLLTAPTPAIDTSESSWAVKQYYKIWINLPYIKDGVIGTCSFIMSEEGRKRFDQFPDIINDDGFVRCCFDSHERDNIQDTTIHIKAPKTLYSLIKIKTRARLGNIQLEASNLCARPKQANYSGSIKQRLLSKEFIPTVVYILIALFIRVRASKQFKKLDSYKWEKDLTSR
jgi:glycosyltransferase involved in cell wall biosynthesis